MAISRTVCTTALTILIVFGMACSLRKDKTASESAVTKFHSQFNAEHYKEIYGQTDEGFRKNTGEQQMIEYLRAVHRKLGEVKDATQVRWRANATSDGTQVFLAYKTTFVEGDATEEFVFIVSDDNPRLFRYNIQSPILITK